MAKKKLFQVEKELKIEHDQMKKLFEELGIKKKPLPITWLDPDEIELIKELSKEKGLLEEKAPLKPKAVPQPKVSPVKADTGVAVEAKKEKREEPKPEPKIEKIEEKPVCVPRPPVVAVLGHVDHGKTSLLQVIRKINMLDKEVGGITQSIGAYQVSYNGKKITFIDTPGHKAFTSMRARGASVTDIAILVVAADDGVMEQTREAIAHARAANVPIIVAINKIDKPGVDVNRVKEQLSKESLMPEDWGGHTVTVPISALTGKNIDSLLEMILLVAELQELRADPLKKAEGVIIESHLDATRGPVATAVIKNGTLREREIVLAGTAYGRVRALLDEHGRKWTEAPPGSAVQILGFCEVPPVGVKLEVMDDLFAAKQLAESRKTEQRRLRLERTRRTLADLLKEQHAKKSKVRLILKADTSGSLEALEHELKGLQMEQASAAGGSAAGSKLPQIELLHTGVGAITESDVLLASTAEGTVIIGFRTGVEPSAKGMAEREGVTIKTYEIIYQVTQDIAKALKGLLAPEFEAVKIGEIEVRHVFHVQGAGTVAGCYVRDGIASRGAKAKVFRNGAPIFEGVIKSLRRFHDDVREVEKGKECGIKLDGFEDVRVGDRIELYTLKEIRRL
mgnify:CR=1 FL=1